MKRAIILLLLMLNMTLSGFAQTDKEVQHARQKRYSMIHAHHIGVGIETDLMENARISPRLYYSFGSFRNLFTIDAGLKYIYSHPMCHVTDEKVTGHYLSPFVAIDFHFAQWDKGCVFAGGEFAYNFNVTGEHYLPASNLRVGDKNIGNNHSSLRAKVGVRLENWVFNVHYEYDLAPSYNQKYIYETADYDFATLRPSLYERHRVGISIAYLFTF